MTKSSTPSVAEYLAQLPPERRATMSEVRDLVNLRLPPGYQEAIQSGMLTWTVPLSRLPETANAVPLWYAALASEKSYCSLHLMGCYGSAELLAELREGFAKAGKKLDMGKACVHFKQTDDLALPVIGKIIAAISVEKYVQIYRESRKHTAAGRKAAAKATTTNSKAAKKRGGSAA